MKIKWFDVLKVDQEGSSERCLLNEAATGLYLINVDDMAGTVLGAGYLLRDPVVFVEPYSEVLYAPTSGAKTGTPPRAATADEFWQYLAEGGSEHPELALKRREGWVWTDLLTLDRRHRLLAYVVEPDLEKVWAPAKTAYRATELYCTAAPRLYQVIKVGRRRVKPVTLLYGIDAAERWTSKRLNGRLLAKEQAMIAGYSGE